MPRSHRFTTLARTLACCLALVLAWPALSMADSARFEIKAEPLSTALKAFAQQAHMQLLYEYAIVRDVRGNPVIGLLEKHAALNKLLRNTGLEPIFSSESAATIRVIPARIPGDGTKKSATTGGDTRDSERKSDSIPSKTDQLGQRGDPDTDSPKSASQHSASAEEFPALQEIIVTAQKYSQRAFDVPISLQVISGQELQQHGITNLSDLQYDVPGLYMNNTGTTQNVYLRGVGNQLGTGAMVGQYIDEADITADTYYSGTIGYATNDGGIYDLQRVEVLKGPQGTLYGDGSMGGVIRYITNKPVLNSYQMSADAAALFTEDGAPSQRIDTMLNTPLVQGTFGLRLAGMFEHDGGWVDEPAANLKNINDGNLSDVRAEARWRPSENFVLDATQVVHRHASGINDGEDASGNITPFFGTTFVPTLSQESNLSNITMTYELPGIRILSSSTYLTGGETVHNEYSETAVPPNPTRWFLLPYERANNEGGSEEIRLASTTSGPWRWSAGGFYKNYWDRLSFFGEYGGIAGSTLSSANRKPGLDQHDSSSSLAGFVDTSYQFFSRLTLGAGVRYFKDRQTQTSAELLGYLSPPSTPVSVPNPSAAATFASTDPRFYVQYRATRHVNVYASASKGFRSGGFNSPPAPNYQPEVLWSYDLGTKIRYPDERLRADVDLFDMHYSSFVSTTYIAPLYLEANVGNARIDGVDADVTWLPVSQWELSLNTEILRTRFLTASAISGYAPGDRLPFAPQYSLTAAVDRHFRWNSKSGELEVYYYEIGRVQSRLANVIPVYQSDVLHFLNFRAAIHWNDNLTLGLFAHNLLNDRGYESPLYYADSSTRPRPRTYGIEFNVEFGK